MTSHNKAPQSDLLSRRSFLSALGTFAAAAPFSLWPLRASAFFNTGAFMKKRRGSGQTSNGYVISNSLRFNGTNAYLSRTFGTPTNNKIWTLSLWIKRGLLYRSSGEAHPLFDAQAATPVKDEFDLLSFGGGIDTLGFSSRTGGVTYSIASTALLRDTSAWMHVVLVADTTDATASNRLRLYINGALASVTASYPPQNYSFPYINSSGRVGWLGQWFDSNTGVSGYHHLDGYLSDVYFIDGQALDATSFGQIDSVTGQWIPKKYAGTYGNNGYFLPFNDATSTTTLGYDRQVSLTDSSRNNWSLTNFNLYDQVLDSPTSNYCTLNPLFKSAYSSAQYGLKSGNLQATSPSTSYVAHWTGTLGAQSGKWYFEVTRNAAPNWEMVGVINPATNPTGITTSTMGESYTYNYSGTKYTPAGANTAYGSAWSAVGAVVGIALDLDSNPPTITAYLNNSSQGLLSNALTSGSTYTPYVITNNAAADLTFNFGQGGISGVNYDSASGGRFKYTPPAGFKALCTANLSAPAIKKPSQYFDVMTYTAGDPYWSNVTFLSHMDSNPPVDVSASGVTITQNNGTAYSTTNSKFGGASASFNGSNNLIMSSSPLNFGSQDFTIELWLYRTTSTAWLFGEYTTWATDVDIMCRIKNTTGALQFCLGGDFSVSANTLLTTSTVPTSAWTHIALVRSGNTVKAYINGVADATSITFTGSVRVNRTTTYIGRARDPGDELTGYIDEFRITKGVARYTSNFTPPSAPFPATASAGGTTSLAYQPDLVWIKNRDTTSNHSLYDSVRTAGKRLATNLTDAEYSNAGLLTGFLPSGFSLGSDPEVNNGGYKFVSWCWRAGTSAQTGNESCNAAAGFSIVKYVGTANTPQSVTHSLNATPRLIIVKNRTNASGLWAVYHESVGNTKALWLHSTSAPDTDAYWNNTSPTSSSFSVGATTSTNGNGNDLIAYIWAEVPGFSRFGSYAGNGVADGPFVYCGFKPRWVMIKQTSASGESWQIWDSAREGANPMSAEIYPNLSNAENAGGVVELDLLSNGFKLRQSAAHVNASNGTYIFAAFAEAPFKYATGR